MRTSNGLPPPHCASHRSPSSASIADRRLSRVHQRRRIGGGSPVQILGWLRRGAVPKLLPQPAVEEHRAPGTMSAAARPGGLLLCRRHRLRPPYPVVGLSRTRHMSLLALRGFQSVRRDHLMLNRSWMWNPPENDRAKQWYHLRQKELMIQIYYGNKCNCHLITASPARLPGFRHHRLCVAKQDTWRYATEFMTRSSRT
ncbi:hypothetical protein MUK42_14274 [Musa troglodytarum]|uniref:Uncharacterized protein n=1 Tax=Musa troglodytarum TaxID=320322 RepID=A0A9E7KSJ6_9LILI|nr:hypothetical protein MUK42_14274 [Musa troglodytarum]